MVNKLTLLKSDLFGKGMLSRDDRFSRVRINHIPIMINEANNIVCLPDYKEVYHIGFTGMIGTGKGIGGNALLGFEYWMKKRSCFILNDFQQETFEMSLPNRNKNFSHNLEIVGVNPIGYPIVYVYPSNKDLIINDEEKTFPYIKMSIPTRVIITNIEKYYRLDKSAKYFSANIEKFLECKDLEEIDEALKEIIEENVSDFKNRKSLENMMFKIRTVFKNIFDEKITDNASPDAPAILTINRKGLRNYNNLVIQSLIAAKLIPSIQTSEIRSKSWFSAYMSFIVESIYEDKYNDPFLKEEMLSMFVPEIDKMWKGDDGNIIKKSLSLIGTNGRRAGIGLRWDAQDYDAVPDSIRSNTKFLFVLRKSNSQEVNGIKKDFNVSKEIHDKILSLKSDPSKGLFECVGFTPDTFVIYSVRNGGMSYTNNPQIGRLITPMAHHKYPGMTLGEVIRNEGG